jgi:nicotinamide phosphoribosyltransferase
MIDLLNKGGFALKSDSYKHSHYKLMVDKLQRVYSYLESRGGFSDECVFFGLHYILKTHFEGVVITHKQVDFAKKIIDAHMGPGIFNEVGWRRIVNVHGGKLPLHIRALPEGTVVPNHCVMMTVENTDDECAFITNFSETLLVQVWNPITVATNSREMLKVIHKYLLATADNLEGLLFKMNDFGYRGVSSQETAAISAAAHLVNSMGTDTLPGIILAMEYYNAEMAGYSIPATEHSVVCSWGREGEFDCIKNLLKTHPTGLVAGVSDTNNIFHACKMYGTELKELIMSRDGTFVVRPDSGHPPTIVCAVLKILCEGFKDELTYVGENKGYKLLPTQIRVIQGDGIDLEMLEEILRWMKQEGYSADNIAFGSGGGLLQKVDRDSLKMAFKASSFIIDGKRHDERKDPITDPGKRSKLGRFKVVTDDNGKLVTVDENDPREDHLQTVYLNGEILVSPEFHEIRERAALCQSTKTHQS